MLVCEEFILIFCNMNKVFAKRLIQTLSHLGYSKCGTVILVLVIQVPNGTICLFI